MTEQGNISKFPSRSVPRHNELRLNENPWTNSDIAHALHTMVFYNGDPEALLSPRTHRLLQSARQIGGDRIGIAELVVDGQSKSVSFQSASGDFQYELSGVDEIITRDHLVVFRQTNEEQTLEFSVDSSGGFGIKIEPLGLLDPTDPAVRMAVAEAIRGNR